MFILPDITVLTVDIIDEIRNDERMTDMIIVFCVNESHIMDINDIISWYSHYGLINDEMTYIIKTDMMPNIGMFIYHKDEPISKIKHYPYQTYLDIDDVR